jgi:hypothetical protein
MRLNARIFAIFAFVLGVAGCSQSNNTASLEQKLAVLEGRLGKAQGELDTLSTEVGTLRMQLAMDRTAYLTPGSTGYSTVKIDRKSVV